MTKGGKIKISTFSFIQYNSFFKFCFICTLLNFLFFYTFIKICLYDYNDSFSIDKHLLITVDSNLKNAFKFKNLFCFEKVI
jgi:hypothetical protein